MCCCPQTPPSNAYISPCLTTPQSSRLVRRLPNLKYLLSDVANLSLAHTTSDLNSSETCKTHEDQRISAGETLLWSPTPHLLLSSPRKRRIPHSLLSPNSAAPAKSLLRLSYPNKWTKRHTIHTQRSYPSPVTPPICPPDSMSLYCTVQRICLPPQHWKGRTKRDLAELQWQMTLHRSLAWRVRSQAVSSSQDGSSDGNKEKHTLQGMNLESGGLMIKLGNSRESLEPHWTDVLDKHLVTRLWEKLLAQGCQPVGNPDVDITSSSTSIRMDKQVPFPTLAAPFQPDPSANARPATSIPRRARVSALVSPSRVNICVPEHSSSNCVREPAHGSPPPLMTPPTRTLTPAQLVAQTLLRRSQSRAKPLRKSFILRTENKPSVLKDAWAE